MHDKLLAYCRRPLLASELHFPRFVQRALSHERCYTAKEVDEAARASWQSKFSLYASNRAIFVDEPNMVAELKTVRAVKGKVAVLPILGPVDQRLSSELMKSGGTPLDAVSRSLDVLLNDPNIGAIILQIDSPGGSVSGVEELATKIYDARARKPIYAIADSLAASAAYWIGSAAGMFIATPGGDVGSIGVLTMHVDESAAIEAAGVKVTFISAGEFKTEFASTGPLSDNAKEWMQYRVDQIYTKFVSTVAKHRTTSVEDVRTNYGKGRVFGADDALKHGMIDRVMSMGDLIGRLTRK